MAESQATLGQGATFYTGSGSGTSITYVPVVECKEIKLPEQERKAIDVTHLLSPGNIEEFIGGTLNPGQIEVQGNYLGDTSQEAVGALLQSGAKFPWKITFMVQQGAKTATVTGLGLLTKEGLGPIAVDKAVDFAYVVKVSGPITRAIA